MKAVIQGEGVPAFGPLPPNYFGYDKQVEQYASSESSHDQQVESRVSHGT